MHLIEIWSTDVPSRAVLINGVVAVFCDRYIEVAFLGRFIDKRRLPKLSSVTFYLMP